MFRLIYTLQVKITDAFFYFLNKIRLGVCSNCFKYQALFSVKNKIFFLFKWCLLLFTVSTFQFKLLTFESLHLFSVGYLINKKSVLNYLVQVLFCFLWAHSGYFVNRIPLKSALGGVCSLANKLQCCIWRDSIKPSLRFPWFCVFFVSKGNPFWLLFSFKHNLRSNDSLIQDLGTPAPTHYFTTICNKRGNREGGKNDKTVMWCWQIA